MNKQQMRKYIQQSKIQVSCDGCGILLRLSLSWSHKGGVYCRDCILKVLNQKNKIVRLRSTSGLDETIAEIEE